MQERLTKFVSIFDGSNPAEKLKGGAISGFNTTAQKKGNSLSGLGDVTKPGAV